MIKWLLAVIAMVVLLGVFAPQLTKLGLGRLPGDVRFRYKGREYYLPITSTILLSLLLTVALRVIRL
ncbi:MAG: DUF2905 domain-containing protein [Betaproteobacteria bacterium]|nr:DUF2905 domain-containing protein [Betaproteobacteria bacterium]